ncbi:hypothetical protein ACTFIU_008821 [Dictyostelium citrinum]
MNIPNYITSCEDLINKLIDMSAVPLGTLPPTVSLKTEIFNGISKLENVIIQYVNEILIEFPLLNELEPYILEQVEILIDRSKYFYSLGEVNRTAKDVEFIIDNYNLLFQNTTDPTVLKNLFKSVLGRVCSTLRNKSKSINYLNHSVKAFHSIPIIQDYLSTCIILGNKTDDLFFSIIMDDNNNSSNNSNNNNNVSTTIKNKNNIKDNYSKRYIREEDFRFDTDYDVRHSDDEDDQEDQEEDEDDEFEEDELLNDDDYYFKSQEAIIRSYKFYDNINFSLKNEDFDNYGGSDNTTINHGDGLIIKPFSIGTINKFQIIETPSLSTVIKKSNNTFILVEMIKSLLRNINGLILFNIDFNVSTTAEVEEQIDYFLTIKQFFSNQILLIFSNCKSSKDSLDFIEFFKRKLLLSSPSPSSSNNIGNNSNNMINSNINIEIPPIFMYEHHVNQIKEYILKFKNFPASPFIKNNLSSMFNGLTVDQQNQMDRLQQEQQRKQQSQEIDFDILDKINKLDLN